MTAAPMTELAARPDVGWVYVEAVRTGIHDVSGTGRVRLDAIARWLQDAAYWDLVDAGWPEPGPWFVRRLRVRVERSPEFAEGVELRVGTAGRAAEAVHLALLAVGDGQAVADEAASRRTA